MDHITYVCQRKRRDFGKPCNFVDVGPVMLTEIDPDPDKINEYEQRKQIDRAIDNTVKMAAHEVNTEKCTTVNRGMNHLEGGWPANVDSTDEETVERFRKNIEKDKQYVDTVKSLGEFMEYFLKENTSIDIYEQYFENEKISRDTEWSISINNVFQDLNAPFRSVLDVSWGKNSTKFAAVYSPIKSANPVMPSLDSYVWDVENNVQPLYIMKPELLMSVVEFSPFNENLILGGYISGQVALWDIRDTNGYAQHLSSVLNSHKNTVKGIKWLMSKEDTVFFSVDTDGQVISWDYRNLSAPVQLDWGKDHFPNLDQDYSVSCVEYDLTLPYKFMTGSEQGYVLSFNTKYKQKKDGFHALYYCGSGPVLNIERNAFFPQLFLSCDAWSLKLWSEDVTDNSILNIVSQNGYYTDAVWSPTRASTVFAIKNNGFIEVFDIPEKIKGPLLKMKVENESLLSVAVAESGSYVICGALSGSIHLLKIPEHLQSISEVEKGYLKKCIKESEEIIGGSPRWERISTEKRDSKTRIDEEWWYPSKDGKDLNLEDYEDFKNDDDDDDDGQAVSSPEKLRDFYDKKDSQEFIKVDEDDKSFPSSEKENFYDERGSQKFVKDDEENETFPPSEKDFYDEKRSQQFVKDDDGSETLPPSEKENFYDEKEFVKDDDENDTFPPFEKDFYDEKRSQQFVKDDDDGEILLPSEKENFYDENISQKFVKEDDDSDSFQSEKDFYNEKERQMFVKENENESQSLQPAEKIDSFLDEVADPEHAEDNDTSESSGKESSP